MVREEAIHIMHGIHDDCCTDDYSYYRFDEEEKKALEFAISDMEKIKQTVDDMLTERKIKVVDIPDMSLDTAREIVNSLRSLYAFKDEEEEAIITLTTPKKVVMKEEGYDERADYYPYCPNCDNELIEPSYGFPRRFCPTCGQFLDWSDVI